MIEAYIQVEVSMLYVILAFGAGLVVGWNFLPQPEFVKDLIEKIKAKL